jgi:hypothetical protein
MRETSLETLVAHGIDDANSARQFIAQSTNKLTIKELKVALQFEPDDEDSEDHVYPLPFAAAIRGLPKILAALIAADPSIATMKHNDYSIIAKASQVSFWCTVVLLQAGAELTDDIVSNLLDLENAMLCEASSAEEVMEVLTNNELSLDDKRLQFLAALELEPDIPLLLTEIHEETNRYITPFQRQALSKLRDATGSTVLHIIAATAEDDSVIKYLRNIIEQSADTISDTDSCADEAFAQYCLLKDGSGLTAFEIAIYYGNDAIVKNLASYLAQCDYFSMIAEEIVGAYSRQKNIKPILESLTPLQGAIVLSHLKTISNDPELISEVISYNPDWSTLPPPPATALQTAISHDNNSVITSLVRDLAEDNQFQILASALVYAHDNGKDAKVIFNALTNYQILKVRLCLKIDYPDKQPIIDAALIAVVHDLTRGILPKPKTVAGDSQIKMVASTSTAARSLSAPNVYVNSIALELGIPDQPRAITLG